MVGATMGAWLRPFLILYPVLSASPLLLLGFPVLASSVQTVYMGCYTLSLDLLFGLLLLVELTNIFRFLLVIDPNKHGVSVISTSSVFLAALTH